MPAFCGLKMATQTNQSKFTATRLSSLEEQVLHSSLIPRFFIIFLSTRKIQIQLFNLLLKTLKRSFTVTMYLLEQMMRSLLSSTTISQGRL